MQDCWYCLYIPLVSKGSLCEVAPSAQPTHCWRAGHHFFAVEVVNVEGLSLDLIDLVYCWVRSAVFTILAVAFPKCCSCFSKEPSITPIPNPFLLPVYSHLGHLQLLPPSDASVFVNGVVSSSPHDL